MKKEDNTVFVLRQVMKACKIKVSNDLVEEYLLAHPYYPTLKSVGDLLNRLKIVHYVIRLGKDEIKQIEDSFIAHLKHQGGQLAFVKKIINDKVFYQTQKGIIIKENLNIFSDRMTGAVILIESGQKISEENDKHIRQNEILESALLPSIITSFFILVFYALFKESASVSFFLLKTRGFIVIIKLIGLLAAVMLVLHEFKINTPLVDKICSLSSKTNCDTVLSSKASVFFGWINWADTGLVYFAGTFIYLAGVNSYDSLCVPGILALLVLPYSVFSIYYQWIKLKKWCPFCLVVQVVLIAESIILFPFVKTVSFNMADLFELVLSIGLSGIIWTFYKLNRQKNNEKIQLHYAHLQLKRNPKLFRFLLKQGGINHFSKEEEGLVLGKSDAPVTITAFFSLYCSPCADTFKKLKAVLGENIDIKANVLFSVYNDEQTRIVINYIYYLQADRALML